ncbi:MAG: hypothetical protein SFV54_24875 [Bryobacteraceae bacterium]|nr:hypothetical protein [Bryobacteraceae bacterium]
MCTVRLLTLLAVLALTPSCSTLVRSMIGQGANQACLVLAGSTTQEINGITRIAGSVRNDCDRRFLNVTVVLRLYRPARGPGSQLPEAAVVGTVRDLEPGQTKDFTTLPVGRDASYRLERISGF